jgi:enoyl-CoA hydratase
MADVSIEVSDHVASLVLDRPPVNALTADTYRQLTVAFQSLRDDPNVNVELFSARGDRAFSAGADFTAIDQEIDTVDIPTLTDRGGPIRGALSAIRDCAVPVVCAVNGAAIGAGFGLVSMCDIVVAADNARFGFTEINVGLLGGISHLTMMVGRYRARDLFFRGHVVTAQQLLDYGVVSEVVASGDLAERAREIALEIAAKSPLALRLAKQSLQATEIPDVMSAYRVEQEFTNRLLAFDDSREAREAFVERRAPFWRLR